MKFSVLSEDNNSLARTGLIETDHSTIETPVFMPVGTHGVVKTLSPDDLNAMSVQIMLSNTYHLYLRPGTEIINENEGLHKFLNWDKSILTDSGGYQVFSLSNMNEITSDGVNFRSHLDGSEHFFTPQKSMEVQRQLGSDIIMAFDYCPPADCSEKELRRASTLTEKWTKQAFEYLNDKTSIYGHNQTLFPIIQGGINPEERLKCLNQMLPYATCGIAIGGLSVGEKKEPMLDIVELLGKNMPVDQPRYLMGVGKPTDLVKAILRGVDMFDCVLPTRSGRTGQAFTRRGEVNLRNARHASDPRPLDAECNCPACQQFSRAYLHHLVKSGEILGAMLLTWHNLRYYQQLMRGLREAIKNGLLAEFTTLFHDEQSLGDIASIK